MGVDWRSVGQQRKARLAAVKDKLWERQRGLCCYCELPMAHQAIPSSVEAVRLGIAPEQVRRRRVTLEHLRRRADGGTDQRDNLALACKWCNGTRGDLDWLSYKELRLKQARSEDPRM